MSQIQSHRSSSSFQLFVCVSMFQMLLIYNLCPFWFSSSSSLQLVLCLVVEFGGGGIALHKLVFACEAY